MLTLPASGAASQPTLHAFAEASESRSALTKHGVDLDSCDDFDGLQFQCPFFPEDSEYLPIVQQWSQGQPEGVVRLVREDADEGRIVLEIWGAVELQVYLPRGNEAFFVTTEEESKALNPLLEELNNTPEIKTLPELLTYASKLFEDHLSRIVESLTNVEDETVDITEANPPKTASPLIREQSTMVLNLDKLQEMQCDLIERVVGLTGLDSSVASLLLLNAHWDDDALLQAFVENPHALQVAAGVAVSEQSEIQPALCCACFVDEPVARLSCGHGLCADCWPGFLRCNLQSGTVEGSNCLRLRCPGESCPLLVPPCVFQQFLQPDDYSRYKRLLLLSFINDNQKIAWCPAIGCELCVAFSQRRSTVTCMCGHSFCFSCSLDAHAPANCLDTKAWLDHQEKLNHVSDKAKPTRKCQTKHIKPCPNPQCRVPTYKRSGCHYMHCTQCNEKWCWMCGHWGGGPSERPEPHHVGKCNDPINKDWYGWKYLDAFHNEGRYLFYYERHANHLNSLEFAKELRENVGAASAEMESDVQIGPKAAELVRESAELLIECRQFLAWTYVWAFFQQDEANRKLFEVAQNELETKTEQLSEMVEGDPNQMSTSWLWVAMGTQRELDDLVVGGPQIVQLDGFKKLLDHICALRKDLESIKDLVAAMTKTELQTPAPQAAPAVAPKAKPHVKRVARRRR